MIRPPQVFSFVIQRFWRAGVNMIVPHDIESSPPQDKIHEIDRTEMGIKSNPSKVKNTIAFDKLNCGRNVAPREHSYQSHIIVWPLVEFPLIFARTMGVQGIEFSQGFHLPAPEKKPPAFIRMIKPTRLAVSEADGFSFHIRITQRRNVEEIDIKPDLRVDFIINAKSQIHNIQSVIAPVFQVGSPTVKEYAYQEKNWKSNGFYFHINNQSSCIISYFIILMY